MRQHYILWAILAVGIVVYEFIFPPQRYDGNLNPPVSISAKKPSTFRICFGSCTRQSEPQPLWQPILNSHPDLWIWLGDNIYADTDDPDVLRVQYEIQKNQPDYRILHETVPLIATWDDHDYGFNSSGADYPMKKMSQQLFLDFIDEPAASSRRTQEGVYSDSWYSPGHLKIHVILLDERYFRTDTDMLGETQWKWLDSCLGIDSASITILGSGTQVFRENLWKEKWSDKPDSKRRLFEVLARHRNRNLIIISGDRHHGELSKFQDPAWASPIFELTSSGMTHYKEHFWYWTGQEKNDFRVGHPFGYLNFGMIDCDTETGQIDLWIVDENGMGRIHHSLNAAEKRVP